MDELARLVRQVRQSLGLDNVASAEIKLTALRAMYAGTVANHYAWLATGKCPEGDHEHTTSESASVIVDNVLRAGADVGGKLYVCALLDLLDERTETARLAAQLRDAEARASCVADFHDGYDKAMTDRVKFLESELQRVVTLLPDAAAHAAEVARNVSEPDPADRVEPDPVEPGLLTAWTAARMATAPLPPTAVGGRTICLSCGHKHHASERCAGHQWRDSCPYVGTSCDPLPDEGSESEMAADEPTHCPPEDDGLMDAADTPAGHANSYEMHHGVGDHRDED